ncbi:hypothetical protein BDV98DRAFT_596006 [Pterulicium gracile]|uniref:Uncharacterized protein n=1 Tax=Pterulicium gracile TaxID=1884261 RepID=A0A5C3Q8C9_9AGAR|nr:hypothetical protein BDV98DRAFT_596006 [Pterula gracilis]
MKKGLAHGVGLGEEEHAEPSFKSSYRHHVVKNVATFAFRYTSRAILHARGTIPRPPQFIDLMDVDDDEQEDEIIILEPPPNFEPRAILPTPEATPKPTHLAVHHTSDDEDEEMKPPFHSEVNLAPEKNNSTRVKKKRARTPVKMEEAALVEGEEVPLPAEDTPLLADETEVAWEAEMEKQRQSPTVYDIVDLGAMEHELIMLRKCVQELEGAKS